MQSGTNRARTELNLVLWSNGVGYYRFDVAGSEHVGEIPALQREGTFRADVHSSKKHLTRNSLERVGASHLSPLRNFRSDSWQVGGRFLRHLAR